LAKGRQGVGPCYGPRAVLRCLYVDLDGTLLGPGGSMFAAADGSFSMDAARALQACDRAGAEVVIYSGRRYSSVFEEARLIGSRAFIFELGCGLVVDGELEWLTDGIEPDADGTIFEKITASGAPDLLLKHFAGRLEYHTPWSGGRDVSHLFRGQVDLDEAAAVLSEAGLGWLRLVDNGVIAAHGVAIDGEVFGLAADRVHAYHLIPAGSSKARAVARHMQNRGYVASECIAAGDSREDMEAAAVVGCFWLVGNAIPRDPTLAGEIAGRERIRVAEGENGAGVYEAVVTTLAES
jgi:phosphoglycolate phosphatase